MTSRLILNAFRCHRTVSKCLLRAHPNPVNVIPCLHRFESTDGNKPKSHKEYIQESPELDKILSDLYKENVPESKSSKQDARPSGAVQQKFEIYKDDDSPVIYDIDEERAIQWELEESGQLPFVQDKVKESQTVEEVKRGLSGVFDIEDLVGLLRLENCLDICVIAVSPDLEYVDYMVVVTCMSRRHLKSVAAHVKKSFKARMDKKDVVPEVEGLKKDTAWIAMDLGNIALHLFDQETREKYDLESLWALGSANDDLSQVTDEVDELLKGHEFNSPVADIKPLT